MWMEQKLKQLMRSDRWLQKAFLVLMGYPHHRQQRQE
jgi:hypothetical protein